VRRAALVLVLALACEASGETVSSPHVELTSDVRHRPLLEKLVATIESALPVLERHVPGLALAPGEKLVFHLYERRADYARACDEQRVHEMKERSGFTAIGGASYLLLEPRSEPCYLARVGDLPETTALLGCHEAVHQWLARTGGAPNDALLPAWYCEGMAERVSALCVGDAVHALERPENALEAVKARELPSLARLLRGEIPERGLLYSCAASFYALLAREPGKLARLHEEIRALPMVIGAAAKDQERFARECARVLEEIYGPLDALEARWRAALAATAIGWFEDGACSQLVPGGCVCASPPGAEGGLLLSGRRPEGESVTVTCELELLDVGPGEARVVLGYEGRRGRRFLEVSLSRATVALEAYSDGRFRPELSERAAISRGTIAPGAKVPIRVTADRQRVRVTSRGTLLLEARVPSGFDVLGGRWGLGARDEVVVFTRIQGP
jgi:hypothetical protein